MDLQKFITQSLVEIMNGLKDAQTQLQDSHARICPTFHSVHSGKAHWIGEAKGGRYITLIDYDIAVEATSRDGSEAKISVVSLLSGGAKASEEESAKTASRIKFSIPVIYPNKDGSIG